MSRQVRTASVDGRPSRRKNEPGMRPAAYIRSSTSTVSGKKSKCSLGLLLAGGPGQPQPKPPETGGGCSRVASRNGPTGIGVPPPFAGAKGAKTPPSPPGPPPVRAATGLAGFPADSPPAPREPPLGVGVAQP